MPDDPRPPRWLAYMPVVELLQRFDPRNPKAHDLDELRASLGRWGYTEPVVLDERTGMLVAGHGRVELLADDEAHGLVTPEGVMLDDENRWLVPVVRGWSSKTDDEAGAYLIASNRHVELGGWLPDRLAALLQDVAATPVGLDGVGYNADQLNDLLAVYGAPASIDELAAQHGPSEPSDFWPTLTFRIPPTLRDRYVALVGELEDDAAVRFTFLLERAEAAEREAVAS